MLKDTLWHDQVMVNEYIISPPSPPINSACVWNRPMSCLPTQGGEVGLTKYASTHEWAPPIDKLWIEMCIDFDAVHVVHFKSSDKHKPSLTLRVALNKSWPRLIWNTHWWLGPYVQWACTCVHQGNFGFMNTVKPPNKGHIGEGQFVPCREVVSSRKIKTIGNILKTKINT